MKIRSMLFTFAAVALLTSCTTTPVNIRAPSVSTEIKSLL
jgi:hypothetical protein